MARTLAPQHPTFDHSPIVSCYRNASNADKARADWYSVAHTFCIGLAERYDTTVEHAAAIVAVFSPRLSWPLNQKFADQFLRDGTAPTFYRTLAKARAIRDNGPDATYRYASPKSGEVTEKPALSGPKVRSFYSNIVDPNGSTDVTIDRHAWDILQGFDGGDIARKALERRGAYQACADAYRKAAAEIGIKPHQLQAVTWCAWKTTKKYARPQHQAQFGV